MRWLIFTFMTVMAMHSGAGTLQPYQTPATGGIGVYMREVISQGPSGYSGRAANTMVAFGESVPRPPSASVRMGW